MENDWNKGGQYWWWVLLEDWRMTVGWAGLGFWAENGASGLCRLGWRYNWARLTFAWPYIIVSMIWKNSNLSALHLSCAIATFVIDCWQFGLSWVFGMKMELIPVPPLILWLLYALLLVLLFFLSSGSNSLSPCTAITLSPIASYLLIIWTSPISMLSFVLFFSFLYCEEVYIRPFCV